MKHYYAHSLDLFELLHRATSDSSFQLYIARIWKEIGQSQMGLAWRLDDREEIIKSSFNRSLEQYKALLEQTEDATQVGLYQQEIRELLNQLKKSLTLFETLDKKKYLLAVIHSYIGEAQMALGEYENAQASFEAGLAVPLNDASKDKKDKKEKNVISL